MNYIAILDYEHLDQPLFMKSFAEAMALQRNCSAIVLHGDSAYTDRLIQTGMLRENAVIRSTGDLNRRIIALLADYGLSGVGVHGFQRRLIELEGGKPVAAAKWFNDRPAGTHLVLSNLVRDKDSSKNIPYSLPLLAEALAEQLNRKYIIIFPAGDSGSENPGYKKRDTFKKTLETPSELIPGEMKTIPENCFLCPLPDFGKLPDTSVLHPVAP